MGMEDLDAALEAHKNRARSIATVLGRPLEPEKDWLHSFAYITPLDKFAVRVNGRWDTEALISRTSITPHLISMGVSEDDIKFVLKGTHYNIVAGMDVIPRPHGAPPASVFEARGFAKDAFGRTVLNLWSAPRISPAPGEYPRIQKILERLTGNDPEGIRWVKHWLAAKVQDPAYLPKIAVLFSTASAAGKGTLFRVISYMLGPDNCTDILRAHLENNFNSRWARKLFVLVDEVDNDNQKEMRDISDKLKSLIDSPTLELEHKGKDQRSVPNRIAWMFATNKKVAPIRVDISDRRYTMFSNHEETPPEHDAMLKGCFAQSGSRGQPTPEFEAEIAAFWHDLLQTQVDYRFIGRPYENDFRSTSVSTNLESYEDFIQVVNEEGFDAFRGKLERANRYWDKMDFENEDWGEQGVTLNLLYQAFRLFCDDTKAKEIRRKHFSAGIQAYITTNPPIWKRWRPVIPKLGKQPSSDIYRVPRRPRSERDDVVPTDGLTEAPAPTAKA